MVAEVGHGLEEDFQIVGVIGEKLWSQSSSRIVLKVAQVASAYLAAFDTQKRGEIAIHASAEAVVQVAVDLFREPLAVGRAILAERSVVQRVCFP